VRLNDAIPREVNNHSGTTANRNAKTAKEREDERKEAVTPQGLSGRRPPAAVEAGK